jgi:hypothetical protein
VSTDDNPVLELLEIVHKFEDTYKAAKHTWKTSRDWGKAHGARIKMGRARAKLVRDIMEHLEL